MKIVINSCYGGFSLSPEGLKAYAKRKGKECYFFSFKLDESYIPVDNPKNSLFWTAFSVPNPDDFIGPHKLWHEMTEDQRKERNERYEEISLNSRPDDRSDPDLIAVVEELGQLANGQCANLKIVEIPDGVQYEIDEYDGIESIHEVHRSWS